MSTSQNDDNLDEGFEDLDAAETPAGDAPFAAGEEGGELAAPSRDMKSAGGSKKKIMILGGLLAILLLGGGGAYMFLTGEDDMPANPPVAMPAPAAPTEATFAAADPAAAPPADPAAAMADPAVTAPAPEALATAPVADPGIAPPVEAAAMPVTDPAATPTVDATAATTVDTAAVTPADPAAVPPVDGAVPPVDGVVPPVDAAAVAATPVDGTAPPIDAAVAAPAEEPADLGAPPSEEATATPLAAAPAETAVAPVTPAPGEPQPDLPMPEQAAAPTPATTVTTTVTQPTGTTTVTTTATTPAGATTPNEAELAIVQNAAILDQVTQPGTTPGATSRPFDPSQPAPSPANAISEVEKLLQQEAIVRPLPPSWLQVKKNYNADDMDTRLTAARTALAQNRNAAALQLFTELKATYPKDSRVLMGRAVSLQKLGQTDEALAAYEELLNANPKNLEALTNMLGLLKSRDPQLAVAKLSELREAYPYQPDITAQLGVALGQAGEYDKALRYLDMAEAMNPGSAYVLYNKAVLHDKMGHAAAAGDLYRQLIRMSADGALDENLPLEQIKRRLSVLR